MSDTVVKMKNLFSLQAGRFVIINAIFTMTAIILERTGIALNMYVYADHFFRVFEVPLMIIVYWIVIGHSSWVVYKKFGCIVGILTGIIIDLPFEFLAYHLGWWTWIPHWSPAIFFNAPVANFLVYFGVSIGSILTYKHVMKLELQ
jgi:hypothetical protein